MVRLVAALAAVLLFALPAIARADLTVNVPTDGNDGVCSPTNCTLREAVILSEGAEVITVPPGDYQLNDTLSVTHNTTVRGAGARSTTIRYAGAPGIRRVVTVSSPATLDMSGVRITGGNDEFSDGGGIFVDGTATLVLTDSAVEDNTANRGGGIWSAGTLRLIRTTIARNHAVGGEDGTGFGGGIEIAAGGTGEIENSTISGNTALTDPGEGVTGLGGGIYTSGNLDLRNVTIADNRAGTGARGDGGGLFQNFGASTTLRTLATNTLVARNSGFNCAGTDDPHQLQSTNGLSDEATVGPSCNAPGPTNLLVADTRLGSLANNGGSTDTMALPSDSPGIDAGGAPCPATDQRGVARPRGARCDIGAYEGDPPQTSPPAQQELPPPEVGKSVNVLPTSGTVKIKLPGKHSFVVLGEGEQIPLGTTVDTRKGRVTLVAAANKSGGTATADFFDGLFKVGQTKGAKPITVLALVEKLTGCKAKGKATIAKKKVKKRRLWGDGHGHFQTKGKHSAATVVGTRWLVQDTCTTTLTKVARGKVSVRDFVKKKTVIVRKGHKYVARAKP